MEGGESGQLSLGKRGATLEEALSCKRKKTKKKKNEKKRRHFRLARSNGGRVYSYFARRRDGQARSRQSQNRVEVVNELGSR